MNKVFPKSFLKESTFFKKIKKTEKNKINIKAPLFKKAKENEVKIASSSGRIKYLYSGKSKMEYIS